MYVQLKSKKGMIVRIFVDKKTGNIAMLNWYDAGKRQFEMEYEWGWGKFTYKNVFGSPAEAIESMFEQVGIL